MDTISHSAITTAAERLRAAAAEGQPCAPVRDLIGETDLAAAYAVQTINNDLRCAAGARIVGRKIGLTSAAVQRQLGVNQPDYGALFNTTEVMNGGEVPWPELMQARIEAEIAFVLSRDLDGPVLTAADMLTAIAYAVAALEIVGSRVEGWNIRITDTIADNASASHFVLGHRPVRLSAFDVTNSRMVMKKGDATVSEGLSAACLGSPVNAALWLARTMAGLGQPLRAGDILLTGAIGPVVPVAPGEAYQAEFEGLGTVSARFSMP